MTSYLEQMAEFDRRRGKETIDPTHIEGGPIPAASALDIPSARDIFGPPVEPAGFDDPSPLVALGAGVSPQAPKPAVAMAVASPPAPKLELAILDRVAAYRGREVELTEQEHAIVRAAVVRALARVARDQLKELEGLLPRRKRKKRGSEVAPAPELPAASPVARKRGRPRKVVSAS